jgi:TRAP-type C4-dicarboxylate transport system permease small subunit
MFFIIISTLHVFGQFFRPSSGAYKTVRAALGIVTLFCCLPLVWMGWNYSNTSITGIDSRKVRQYPRLQIQFYKLLMMGGKTAQNM